MIRVIKHGKKIYTVTCRRCGCVFEFTNDDINDNHSSNGDYVSINCPECDNRITSWSPNDWLKKVLDE